VDCGKALKCSFCRDPSVKNAQHSPRRLVSWLEVAQVTGHRQGRVQKSKRFDDGRETGGGGIGPRMLRLGPPCHVRYATSCNMLARFERTYGCITANIVQRRSEIVRACVLRSRPRSRDDGIVELFSYQWSASVTTPAGKAKQMICHREMEHEKIIQGLIFLSTIALINRKMCFILSDQMVFTRDTAMFLVALPKATCSHRSSIGLDLLSAYSTSYILVAYSSAA
jgi:hypothetical protein